MLSFRTVQKKILPALCFFVLATGLGLEGCRCNKGQSIDPEKEKLAFRGDRKQELPTTDDPMCPRPTRVDEPAKEDMYYPFAEAYKAALMDDGDEAFLRFDAQFEKQSDAARLERKRQYWPRIRDHVRKYVPDPDEFSFEICRVEEKNGGVMRITVRSHVRSKSHTPSRVRNVDGSWKFTSFSY
jgi:hypothetical protein